MHDIAPAEIEDIDVTIKLANRDTISPKPIVTASFSLSILALTVFKKGLPNIMGQSYLVGNQRTRKSAGYLVFPHKTSTYLTIPPLVK